MRNGDFLGYIANYGTAVGRSSLGNSQRVMLLPVLLSSLDSCSPLRPKPARRMRLSMRRKQRRTLRSRLPRLPMTRNLRHPLRSLRRRPTRPRLPSLHPHHLPALRVPPGPRRSFPIRLPPSRARARASVPVAAAVRLTAGVVPRAAQVALPLSARNELVILSPVMHPRRPRPRWSPNGSNGSDGVRRGAYFTLWVA